MKNSDSRYGYLADKIRQYVRGDYQSRYKVERSDSGTLQFVVYDHEDPELNEVDTVLTNLLSENIWYCWAGHDELHIQQEIARRWTQGFRTI